MKGITGIIVAIGLGIAGAAANLFYLHAEAQKVDTISFIGIDKGVTIGRGERLPEDKLVEVKIPKNQAANLDAYAYRWEERVGLKGDERVWRALGSGDYGVLLLREDLKEPLKELELAPGESIRWIPIESRSYVPSLITPGDQVMFIVPKKPAAAMRTPTPAPQPKAATDAKAAPDAKPADPAKPANPVAADPLTPKPDEELAADYTGYETEEIGPFTVLSVGNRLGDLKVMQAAKIPQQQENVLGIRVGPRNSKEWVDVTNLWNRLQALNFRQIGVAKCGK